MFCSVCKKHAYFFVTSDHWRNIRDGPGISIENENFGVTLKNINKNPFFQSNWHNKYQKQPQFKTKISETRRIRICFKRIASKHIFRGISECFKSAKNMVPLILYKGFKYFLVTTVRVSSPFWSEIMGSSSFFQILFWV